MSNLIKSHTFISEIKELIFSSKKNVVTVINKELTLLYWHIGNSINKEVLKEKRGEYGKQVVVNLSKELTNEFGKGWSKEQLRHCMRIALIYNDIEIVYTLCTQFNWSKLRALIYIEDDLERDFYLTMCKQENWSVRELKERKKSMLYERTAISKKPELTIADELKKVRENSDDLSQDVFFRDPVILDFLGLSDKYSEKNFEKSIIAELQRFIIEMGRDFAFLESQKRITIDNRNYYIDLLFYHRSLKSLVVIDLKIGEFEANYKGQMELYLRYLEKYEMVDGENSPIGLILCSGKNDEHIELIQLDKSNIKVAEYLTELPPKKLLEKKLYQSIEIAKNKLLASEK